MKGMLLALCTLGIALGSFAQNVGVGTNTPLYRLHVLSDEIADLGLHTSASNAKAILVLRAVSGVTDLIRNGSTTLGTNAGLPAANLTRFWASGGSMLIGTNEANNLHFATNNAQRMVVAGNGNVGINTNLPIYLFSIIGKPSSAISHYVFDQEVTGQRVGIYSAINSNSNGSMAVSGAAFDGGGGVSPIISGRYALLGQTNTATAVGGFSVSGTALLGSSTSGLALQTSGAVRLQGIGETLGAVLTSDGSGNATWQPLQANAGVWKSIGNDIENNNTGTVRVSDFWVQSAFGSQRIGYPDNGWYWSTIGGGTNLQLWSYTGPYPSSTDKLRAIYSGASGQLALNPTNSNPPAFAQLLVYRGDELTTEVGAERGAIAGINRNAAVGSGIYGISSAPVNSLNGFAGVTGFNIGSGSGRFGVYGSSSGSIVGSDYSAGVFGTGIVGVMGRTTDVTGTGVLAQNSTGRTALEINNGFLKVSGTNKTAFTVTGTAGNTSGHTLALSYSNQAVTDIVIAVPNFNPGGGGGVYHNVPIGVYWNGTAWAIFSQDIATPMLGKSFNVLVIKQ